MNKVFSFNWIATSCAIVVALALPAQAALAQWQLDNERSSLNFISIKNDSVAETHSFTSLSGTIGEEGDVEVDVNLDSVNTLIDIRNERMREMLFNTASFPLATVRAEIDPALLAGSQSETLSLDVPVTLSLHGEEKTLSVPLVAMLGEEGELRVMTARPVVVNARDFGLESGVTALQKVAGLQSIATAIPVTLQLVFTPSD